MEQLRAELDILRTELEIRKRESALAQMEAERLREDAYRRDHPRAPSSYRPRYTEPEPKRSRYNNDYNDYGPPSRTRAASPIRPAEPDHRGPDPRYRRPQAAPRPSPSPRSMITPAGAPARHESAYAPRPRLYSAPPPAAASPVASRSFPPPSRGGYRNAPHHPAQTAPPGPHNNATANLRRLQMMRNKLRGPPRGTLLIQYAGDLLYDICTQPATYETSREMERLFTEFHEFLKAEMEGPAREEWVSASQEIKTFFETGFRCKRYLFRGESQENLFYLYVDVLNLLITQPQEPPPDLEPLPGCWLRPTLSYGLQAAALKLQDAVVPDSLGQSDLLVELCWDLELDIYRKRAGEVISEAQTSQRKRGLTKLALSILQNFDFAAHRPGEGPPSAPPVIVVCHSKALVLKLADTLNYLARYEYGLGFRGAEAAYRDTGDLSAAEVSVLACTPGRIVAELGRGTLSMRALRLLVFTLQGSCPSDYLTIRDQAPEEARVMLFVGTRTSIRTLGGLAPQLLRAAPLRLVWNEDQMTVEQGLPSQEDFAAPRRPPKRHSSIDFGAPDLNAQIGAVLAGDRVHTATPLQRLVVPQMMSGDDRVFVGGEGKGTVLAFVVPTVHLLMNFPPSDPRPRVLVLASRVEDVDRVVGEYRRLTMNIPDAGLSAEGLHRYRVPNYETPFNSLATAIVGTTAKVGHVLKKLDKAVDIDFSALEVLVIYKLTGKKDLSEAAEVHRLLRQARSQFQVVLFLQPHTAATADDLVRELCPSAGVVAVEE